MLNCHFSQVEMMLTDAREAMVLTSAEAVATDEKITEDVCAHGEPRAMTGGPLIGGRFDPDPR